MSERKDLVLTKDTVIDGDLVCGDIYCQGEKYFSLRVNGKIDAQDIDVGNIDARDIDAWNIDARDINAWNIDVRDINAWNIDARDIDAGNINAGEIKAGDIDAWNINAETINAGDIDARDIDAGNINAETINARVIFCESRVKKSKTDKTIAFRLITQRSSLTREEQMPDDTTKQVDER